MNGVRFAVDTTYSQYDCVGAILLFSLAKSHSARSILERELLPFVIALCIAQIFFKWGSFALELLGFIATWFVLGFVADAILRAIRK